MSLKKDSLFYEIFNLSDPWEIIIISLSKSKLRVDFKLDYKSDTVRCPICNACTPVVGKTSYTWKYLDLLEYSTQITAYLPTVDNLNPDCKVCFDQTALSNLLLLDLILKQLKNTGVLNPLRYLFDATSSGTARKPHKPGSFASKNLVRDAAPDLARPAVRVH
jgi:hypothetical protein